MSKPLLTTSLVASYVMIAPLGRASSAMSSAADSVRESVQEMTAWSEKSFSLFGSKAEALSALAELAEECRFDDWDGCGALAVDYRSLCYAEAILRSLPDSLPIPEFSIEPDGCVSFDWMPSPTSTFTMSIATNKRLPYAWVDGSNRGSAVDRWGDDQLPTRILDEVRRITLG